MEAKCDRFEECKFVKEYVKDDKSPWYNKFCNGEYSQCKRHIYCCSRFNTKGKSMAPNYSPTGSLL